MDVKPVCLCLSLYRARYPRKRWELRSGVDHSHYARALYCDTEYTRLQSWRIAILIRPFLGLRTKNVYPTPCIRYINVSSLLQWTFNHTVIYAC